MAVPASVRFEERLFLPGDPVRCARLLFQDRPDAFADFLAKAMIDYSDIQRFLPQLVAGVARGRRRIVKDALPSGENQR